MAKSSVLIELTSNPTDGEIFNILSDNTSNIEIRFKDDVVNINDVEISFNNRFTTENLKNVLDNVYNSLGEYTITLETQTSIKLESTIDNTVFTKDESGFSSGSLTITNEVVIIPITIESWTFPIEQPDSPDGCTKCNILIRTNLKLNY